MHQAFSYPLGTRGPLLRQLMRQAFGYIGSLLDCVCRGQLNTLQNGMVTSASLLGAVIGSAIAIFLRDKIGRKFELLLAAGCYGERHSNYLPDLTTKACAAWLPHSLKGLTSAKHTCT